jgi:hypothetical protein
MSGNCAIYSIDEKGSSSSVFLMTAWNHNAARPKPLGRPTKSNALLETVYWDTVGNPSCTCDRGRLSFGAACAHKLALQALQERRQASHQSIQKGQRVVEAPCSSVGQRVFGVYWNAVSPSPERTMVHFSAGAEFEWYCEGRRSGCSKTADCSHLQEVKRALQTREGVVASSRNRSWSGPDYGCTRRPVRWRLGSSTPVPLLRKPVKRVVQSAKPVTRKSWRPSRMRSDIFSVLSRGSGTMQYARVTPAFASSISRCSVGWGLTDSPAKAGDVVLRIAAQVGSVRELDGERECHRVCTAGGEA